MCWEEMLLPNLSKLFLATDCASTHRDKRHKPGRVELSLSIESELIGEYFHSGCISLVEMVIAKVTSDAFLQSAAPGQPPFHDVIEKPIRKIILPIRRALMPVLEEIERLHAAGSTNPDIAKCKAIMHLTNHKKILDNEQVLMYRDFLLNYLAERDISENDLLSKNPFSQDEDEDDSDCEDTRPKNSSLYAGISSIMSEYFTRPEKYAVNRYWDHPLRAYAQNSKGKSVCVGIVMIRSRDDRDHFFPHLTKATIRIQGIVGDPIYRTFYHAPIGNAFLAYAQELAAKEDKIIIVAPIGNEQWKKKLINADNVKIGEKYDD